VHPGEREYHLFPSSYLVTQEANAKLTDTSEILKIQADISSVPKNQFAQVRGAGRQSFYKIPYQIEATILSGSITFTILYRGKRYEASKEFL
jgi:hypothetical protein